MAFVADDCARVLVDAWRDASRMAALPDAVRPRSLEQGYDAQDAFIARSGAQRAGWKLGVGNVTAMRAFGISRALVGQLDRARLRPSGTVVTLPDDAPITVECEIAFELAHDIVPDAPSRPVLEHVASACVTFELVRSRFVDRKVVGAPSFAADNVGFETLIVGDRFDASLIGEVDRSVVVWLDGAEKARAQSGDDATDPIESLTALIEHARERGMTLKAGDLVSTGAMAKPFDISGKGHEVVATFLDRRLSFRI